jgi:hypothetical protein
MVGADYLISVVGVVWWSSQLVFDYFGGVVNYLVFGKYGWCLNCLVEVVDFGV